MLRRLEGEDGLQPFLDDPDIAKASLAESIIGLTKVWREAFGDFPLPGQVSKESEALPIHLEIAIPLVSEEVYRETRRAVEATGVFITSVRSVSIRDLLAEDELREQRGKPRRLGYVNESKRMRATVPLEMEVFIDPNAVRIEGSNNLPTNTQKQMIQDAGERFRDKLPQGVRSNVVFDMMDPSTMSQLEDAWMDAGRGLLLPDYAARTDVQTVPGCVANVGRGDPTYRRVVSGWGRDFGLDHVFAVPVGVLPRKSAV